MDFFSVSRVVKNNIPQMTIILKMTNFYNFFKSSFRVTNQYLFLFIFHVELLIAFHSNQIVSFLQLLDVISQTMLHVAEISIAMFAFNSPG